MLLSAKDLDERHVDGGLGLLNFPYGARVLSKVEAEVKGMVATRRLNLPEGHNAVIRRWRFFEARTHCKAARSR